MGLTKSPPSLTQSSSQKKQQSISNFFSAKPTASTTPTHAAVNAECDVPIADREDSGLFIESDENGRTAEKRVPRKLKRFRDVVDGGNALPEAKRLRQSSVESYNHVVDYAGAQESVTDHGPISDHKAFPRNASGNVTKLLKATARTSKYIFSSSPTPALGKDGDESDDEQTSRLKERLHQKFVRKLGKPDSIADIKRRNHSIAEQTQEGEDGEDDEDAEKEASPAPAKSKGRKGPAPKKRDKLTPMEKQFLGIKSEHLDTVLIVEVGYKFRFFGEDARIAAKALSIVCIPGKFRYDEHPSEAHLDRFASASFPVHRLHVHVKRLVSAGHKVGVVRQLETAALKAAGENRNKEFKRGLTNLYTKGTYIDDQEGLDRPVDVPAGGTLATGHLICVTETRPKGWGTDERVQLGLVAVQPATGDIIYDDCEDGWMRSELETRLLHIAPCEFLIVGDVSRATENLIQHLSGSKTNVFGDKARVERVEKPRTMAAQAYSHITNFYADKVQSSQSAEDNGALLDKVHKLSENATVCLSAMITHLTEYGLEHVFDLTKYFQSFSARSHMLLNGNTLTSLEIYQNQTDHTARGSLVWTMDRTQTRFGQRLFRKWVGRPLLDRTRLDERVAAVEELKDSGQITAVDKLRSLLDKVKGDLEKSLVRIYYKKCSRSELLACLQTLQIIAQEYAHVTSPSEAGFRSALLSEAINSLPKITDHVVDYLERINTKAARENDKYSFFREEYETDDITNEKVGIAAVEHDFEEHKRTAAEKLKKKHVDYVTVAAIEYLIEVDNTQLKNVPASWAKISGTKKVSRFHTPEVVKMIKERDQHKEALSNACDAAFTALLGEISSKYQAFRDCVQSLATLDCLLSLADVASQPGYCKPDFTDELGIEIVAGRHPMVEQILVNEFVPNDVRLSADATKALLVTGPNMGGKSSYVRSVALIAIMAQIGSYVPADSARLGLLDAVFTRMGAFDNMMKGESTFMVEVSETSDILKQATPRSLVILDELGRGTSTHDGVAIAQAVLTHMVSTLRSFTLFITHYQALARVAEQWPAGELKNVHMRFTEHEDETSGEQDITFLYEVGEGVAHRSYGLNVARLAGLTKEVLDAAGKKSKAMEEEEARRRLAHLAYIAAELVIKGTEELIEHLVAGIEQL